ncbi:M48 family metallopeptidase [Thermococcus waiotapuensis]|uniref:SprT family zinc-dependent metalloprotease n=1 Tax=Thermococcus waiotapuensis TaxID=90909 RepID=A0AAE4T444_9EURY|nr:SprT family zinc-dependent metalloprotease [Thermococcus waiotapuensis]MDV3104483.1 SprT family zinc-dependent metalloprotease [Thermococcus waiotapuensis]
MNLEIRRRPVRYARIEMKPNGVVVVTAPEGFDVDSFVERHKEWIEAKLAEIESRRTESGFPIDGELYQVIRGRKTRVHGKFRTVVFSAYPDEAIAELKSYLRPGIMALVEEYSGKMGVFPKRVFIRHQRSRWGSCSPRGNINFNVRLVSVPPWLKEYVVIHELAHLKHMNHSKAFWEFVGRFYPDYRKARKELKKWWSIIELNPYWRWLGGGE